MLHKAATHWHAYHCCVLFLEKVSAGHEAVKFTANQVKSGLLRSSSNVDSFRKRTIGGQSSWMSMGQDAIFNLQCEI